MLTMALPHVGFAACGNFGDALVRNMLFIYSPDGNHGTDFYDSRWEFEETGAV